MKGSKPQTSLVSVVTVTFNNRASLQETILNVAMQDYPHLEHLVIDGASIDETSEILCCADIERWISEPDEGIYDAMNKGISICSPKSEYVIFMNAGDLFSNNYVIEEMIRQRIDEGAHLYGDVIRGNEVIKSPDRLTFYKLSTNMVCHQAIFFKTQIIKSIQYDKTLKLCADYKLILELLKAGERFEKVSMAVAIYDGDGVSSIQRDLLFAEKNRIRKLFPSVYFWYLVKKYYKKPMGLLKKWMI